MDKREYAAKVAELPPAAQDVLNALEGAESHQRIATALFLIVESQRHTPTLTHDQLFDLFNAGMRAHRIASVESFMDALFFKGDGLAQLKKSGGISAAALAAIGMRQVEEGKKAAERFINLTHMLEASK